MSGTLTIYGASDDLVEVEGDVRAEFGAYSLEPEGRFLACSDGTMVRVQYADNGCWELRVVRLGDGTTADHKPHDNDETTYTDRLTLTAPKPFTFVVFGDAS